MQKLLFSSLLALSLTSSSAAYGWWVCDGSPLSNPMERRVCGQGPDEFSARRTCGFDLVNISCWSGY
jgi:hypothetical protein